MSARRSAAGVVLALAAFTAGCGGKHASSPAGTTIARGEAPACQLLLARLERVTIALRTSSELIAHSLNKRQLSHRIAIEQVQLHRSARLMAAGPVPTSLLAADRSLVAGLRAFARDFARAKTSASRGDFAAATAAMTDPPVVRRILAAARTIERTCA